MTIPIKKLAWKDIYSENELYRAAIRLYTPSLFNWRKALGFSTDEKNLYDFARHGLPRIDRIHQNLKSENFCFRAGRALDINFKSKKRVLYIYPWEERLVDLLLYRMLNHRLDPWFSKNSYAYRLNGLGINNCQKKISTALKTAIRPLFIMKRDFADYFNSIDHHRLLEKLEQLIDADDFLFRLLSQRIAFLYEKDGRTAKAVKGVPFGTAIACCFANIYLTELDQLLEKIPDLNYFRYSDDILMFSEQVDAVRRAKDIFSDYCARFNLADKENRRQDFVLSPSGKSVDDFSGAAKFKHLGLEYRADGSIGLSRDKARKIRNIFRYALKKKKSKLGRIRGMAGKINFVVAVFKDAIENGIRNVAIIDYYLRHVDDENQLKLLDRWMAEEALAVIFANGHKKGNFKKIGYGQLRQHGLPSLVHRRRLIDHGHLDGSFFRWQQYKKSKACEGTAAKPLAAAKTVGQGVFSPLPKAAAAMTL